MHLVGPVRFRGGHVTCLDDVCEEFSTSTIVGFDVNFAQDALPDGIVFRIEFVESTKGRNNDNKTGENNVEIFILFTVKY